MAISASTYRKILSIKTWATNKLPTVTEDSYTSLLTDLLKYLDDLITNNDFFETDIKKLVDELNKLLNMTFPSQEDINNAINSAKKEITKEYTQAINASKQILDEKITDVSTKIDTKMDAHKKNIKDTITGAMTNLTEGK